MYKSVLRKSSIPVLFLSIILGLCFLAAFFLEKRVENKLIVTSTNLSSVSDGVSVSATGENISAKNSSGRKVDYFKVSASDDIFIRQALSLFAWNEICQKDNRKIDYKMTRVSLDGGNKGLFVENEQGVGKKAEETLVSLYSKDASQDKSNIIDYLIFLQLAYAPKNIYDDYYYYYDGNGDVVITPGKVEYSFNTFSNKMAYLSYKGEERVLTLEQLGFDGDESVYNEMAERWAKLRSNSLSDEKLFSTVDSYASSMVMSGYPKESGKYFSDDSFDANDYYLDAVNSFKGYLGIRLKNLDNYYKNGYEDAMNEDKSQIPSYDQKPDKASADFSASVADGLPSVYITNANGTMDYINDAKGHKEPASFIAVDTDGEVNSEGMLTWIKGKGHSSFTHSDKKSYQIMFEEATDVLGMGKASHYVLQANALDPAKIRNYVAYNLAKDMGMPYSSDTVYVNLYLNGEYWGCYMLLEPVEVAEGRMNSDEISCLFEINNAEDERTKEGNIYFKDNAGLRYELDYPDEEEDKITDDEIEAITEIVSTNVDGVMKLADNKDNGGGLYLELSKKMNMDSFANMFIMDMLFDDVDANALSTFYYIDSKGVMNAGPVWDYDLTLGNHGEREIDRGDSSFINGIPEWLFECGEFRELVSQKWDGYVCELVYKYADDEMYKIAKDISSGLKEDRVRWSYEDRTPNSEEEWLSKIDEASEFMKKRATFIDEMLQDGED